KNAHYLAALNEKLHQMTADETGAARYKNHGILPLLCPPSRAYAMSEPCTQWSKRSSHATAYSTALRERLRILDKLRLSRSSNGRDRQRTEFVGRWGQVFLGIHGHVPGDLLASVGGHASHDGH